MSIEFLPIYEELWYDGVECSPRGKLIKELRNYQFSLMPYSRITSFKARKLNLDYLKWEFLWYLRANPFDKAIEDGAQMWKDIVQPNGEYFSNYGQYWFGPEQNGFVWAYGSLLQDKDSRQAVIPMLHSGHLFEGNKDVVCTYGISFHIRDNHLHMSVHMRSQDAIWGMTNDIASFSFLHEMMYMALKDGYDTLQIGDYTHTVDSFHVYERHWDMLKNIMIDGVSGLYEVDIPKIVSPGEVFRMIRYNECEEEDNPHYKFFNWLKDNKYGQGRVRTISSSL